MSDGVIQEQPQRRTLGTKFKYKGVHEREWKEQEVEQPLTVLCHQGDVQVDVDNAIPMNYEVTTYHGERVDRIDPVAKLWIEHVLGFSIDGIAKEDRPKSVQHVIGMVDLPIKLMQQHKRGLPFFFKEPETSLHPSQQQRVMDFISTLLNEVNDDGVFIAQPSTTHEPPETEAGAE